MAFDESAYLAANPDVAAAVAAGAFSSGSEHYAQYGASEGRDAGGAYGGTAAAQPNYASGAGYASNITAPVGSTAYYAQLQDALGAYRAGSGVNPITGKTSAEEAGTWWNPGNNGMSNYYLANPDVMMNYLVNAGAKGVDPQQYAVAHSDMAQAGFDPGRQGLLPTGQTNFERLIGKEGGSVYNTFGQGESVFLDPRRGMVTPESDQAKYQQVYGNMRSNIGPFAGMETSYDRAGIQNSLTSAFNSVVQGVRQGLQLAAGALVLDLLLGHLAVLLHRSHQVCLAVLLGILERINPIKQVLAVRLMTTKSKCKIIIRLTLVKQALQTQLC